MAIAPLLPAYQASMTAGTRSSHGITTGPPVSSTTMVCGLAAAAAGKNHNTAADGKHQRLRVTDGDHLRGATARENAKIGVRSDHRNRPDLPIERQSTVPVLEQNDAFLSLALCNRHVSRDIGL